MRSTVVPILAMVLAGTVLPSPARASTSSDGAAATGRAMWVWDRPDPATLVSDARAAGVDTLFVAVPPSVATSGDLPRLREVVRQATGAGMSVQALGGDPGWTTNNAAAMSWARSAAATGLFAGLHVDVEPYALRAWTTKQASTVASFTALLDKLHTATTLPVDADVPFWYGQIPASGGTLADAVLARVDAVTVMSYRDTASGPNSVLDIAADTLTRASATGTPVRLGLETNPLPDCPYCTFAEKGRAALDVVATEVAAGASTWPAYRGIAVHDHTGWQALQP